MQCPASEKTSHQTTRDLPFWAKPFVAPPISGRLFLRTRQTYVCIFAKGEEKPQDRYGNTCLRTTPSRSCRLSSSFATKGVRELCLPWWGRSRKWNTPNRIIVKHVTHPTVFLFSGRPQQHLPVRRPGLCRVLAETARRRDFLTRSVQIRSAEIFQSGLLLGFCSPSPPLPFADTTAFVPKGRDDERAAVARADHLCAAPAPLAAVGRHSLEQMISRVRCGS